VLVVHEKRLFDGLRRKSNQRRAGLAELLFDLRQDEIHRFHLPHAKRAPSPADKANDESFLCEQIVRRNDLAIVILQIEVRDFRADGKSVLSNVPPLQFGDGLRVHRLRLGWNIFRDQFFPLGIDFAQRSNLTGRNRFFERAPFHRLNTIKHKIHQSCARCIITIVRTNINLDDDVHQFARTYAAAKGISLSAAVSELLRRAEVAQPQAPKISRSKVTGLAAFPSSGKKLTSEMIREAESDLE
jgi:hypothetical protein